MTKTQANEPGFVLVPPLTAAQLADALGYFSNDVITAMHNGTADVACIASGIQSVAWRLEEIAKESAAAPIVPAPAYGVKEALEPFAKILEHDIGADEADADLFRPMDRHNRAPRLTVGDFRRAYDAYDALSSAPVEEADAKAGDFVLVPRQPTDEMVKAGLDGGILAGREGEPWAPAVYREMLATAPTASTIPSEPEAKGEAGAGPVRCSSCDGTGDLIRVDGEWIGWCPCGAAANAGAGPVTPEDRAEQYIQAAIDRAPEPLRRLGEWLANKLDEDDWKTAERMLLGAATAHPVEEPGEVERRELARIDRIHERAFNDGYRHGNSVASARAETAEAALAETRERLEKVEAALREIASLEEYDEWTANGHAKCNRLARAALSTQESSAALAGDGKEAGL